MEAGREKGEIYFRHIPLMLIQPGGGKREKEDELGSREPMEQDRGYEDSHSSLLHTAVLVQ